MTLLNTFSILQGRTLADWITLTSLLPVFLGLFFIFSYQPQFAILCSLGAFFLDTLDGYYARKTNTSTLFGRFFDSFVDLLNYILLSLLLFLFFVSETRLLDLVAAILMLMCGTLRLTRFNTEGIQKRGDVSYYRGLPVPFMSLLIFTLFFVQTWIVLPSWLAPLLVIIFSLAMISDIFIPKPSRYTFWYPVALLFLWLTLQPLFS